jgi:methylphosphotriester-DNA--protein-cysteine methyltransferase
MIGQYSMGGPDAKRRILAAEGLDTRALEAEAAAGIRFIGSNTTHIVCHPTCRDAKRVTPRHRIRFASLAAAATAGYRPCLHCRPVSLAAA